ncbi:hypothetical protein FIBSPDRAFT_850446, partial [Athelia psychrophila]
LRHNFKKAIDNSQKVGGKAAAKRAIVNTTADTLGRISYRVPAAARERAAVDLPLRRVSVTAGSAVTGIPKEPSGRYPRWTVQYNKCSRRSPRARPPWMSGR